MDTTIVDNAEARIVAMDAAVADLRRLRTDAIAEIKGGFVDGLYTTSNEGRSIEWLEGSANTYINMLDSKRAAVIGGISATWTYDYWRGEAGNLYKQIAGEPEVAGWSLWKVLTGALTASYEDTVAAIKDATPSSTELYVWAAIIVVVLLLIAVIKVT